MAVVEKPHLIPVRDQERNAVLRELATGDLGLPVGGVIGGIVYAYKWSIEKFRKRASQDSGASQ